jgi:hypothetical protein
MLHVTLVLLDLRLRARLIRDLTKYALCARSHADIPLLSAHHTLVCTSHSRPSSHASWPANPSDVLRPDSRP